MNAVFIIVRVSSNEVESPTVPIIKQQNAYVPYDNPELM